MKKSSKFVDIYSPNKTVRVTVTNTPKYDDGVFVDYNRSVTITIAAGRDKEQLKFQTDDAIARFIETVDFEEMQQALPLNENQQALDGGSAKRRGRPSKLA